jgi:hypothetical protein
MSLPISALHHLRNEILVRAYAEFGQDTAGQIVSESFLILAMASIVTARILAHSLVTLITDLRHWLSRKSFDPMLRQFILNQATYSPSVLIKY